MAISPMKHAWAADVLQSMQDNTWFPKEVNLADDIVCYKERLSEAERFAYDKALAFLSNLDGIQFNNINLNIARHVTSPEVRLCLSRQAWEEGLHVLSYARMVEAVSLNPMSVYMTFERDGILAKKNEFILKQSRIVGEEFTARGFALACVSNLLLEGVYFYSGFLVFYTLARQGKMLGSADMIRYIQRDEGGSHLNLFAHMLSTLRVENPEIFDDSFWRDALKIFHESTLLESGWGKYQFSGGVLGVSDQMIDQYIRHLANTVAITANMPFVPYPEVTSNPFAWVDSFSKPNGTESNFFETRPTDYTVGTLEWS
ncbi:ribonucleotide-diphosphate reductase subunit beta [Acinetobacter brisouii]|uniref:ribonucleotide-diphosphate reductase subunit beta n=1 Tax=Acinetobacter brisouii TaxID=396323 RepID=UPI00124CC585|nr:ribonucleotide-diphosphate reductase subunit beta [Acinetobacter brisouii]